MARKPLAENLQQFQEELREDIHRSLCSSTADLISALQDRQLEKGRELAVELFPDFHLCNNDHPTWLLSRIVALVYSEDPFLHCDQLSTWLLELELELQQLPSSCPHVPCGGAVFPCADETSEDEPLVRQSWTGGFGVRAAEKA